MAATGTRTAPSEELLAATRVLLGLSAAVGAVAGVMGLVSGEPKAWLLLPTLGLVGAMAARATMPAAWWAAILWALVLPHAHAEGMLGPLVMIAACVAVAVGPSRLAELVIRDWRGARPSPDEPAGWTEDADPGPQ
jgi:hypothetical protein